MKQDTTVSVKSKTIIDAVEPTEDILSGRAGLSLVARFPRHGGWLEQIAAGFTGLRKSRKGQPVAEVFKQLICFFFDGSRRHLVHFEQLPFHRFVANAAFYYVMMLSFVLFELFKQRVCSPVIDTRAYASSLRRRLIDQAAKIVRHAGRIILKLPRALYEHLHFYLLWQNSTAAG